MAVEMLRQWDDDGTLEHISTATTLLQRWEDGCHRAGSEGSSGPCKWESFDWERVLASTGSAISRAVELQQVVGEVRRLNLELVPALEKQFPQKPRPVCAETGTHAQGTQVLQPLRRQRCWFS